MQEVELFVLSDQALTEVVDQIAVDQCSMALPEWFALGSSQDRTKLVLRDIINYHAYDEAWVPDVLAGKLIAEVGKKFDGDLLGTDPKVAWRALVDQAIEAVLALTPESLNASVHLTYGDFPALEYLKHISSFRAFRAYDIAKLIGAKTQLPVDLLTAITDLLVPEAEQWRAMGVYGTALPVPETATNQQKIMALFGRPE